MRYLLLSILLLPATSAELSIATSDDDWPNVTRDDGNTWDARADVVAESWAAHLGYTQLTDRDSWTRLDIMRGTAGARFDWLTVSLGGEVAGNLGGRRIQNGFHRMLDQYCYDMRFDPVRPIYRPLAAVDARWSGFAASVAYLGDRAEARACYTLAIQNLSLELWERHAWGATYGEANRVFRTDGGHTGITATVSVHGWMAGITACRNDMRGTLGLEMRLP